MKYREYKEQNPSQLTKELLRYWKENQVFEKSVNNRPEKDSFTFYE